MNRAIAQDVGLYGVARIGLQHTAVGHSPNAGLSTGFELGVASLPINLNAHAFLYYDYYRSGLGLAEYPVDNVSRTWHTDSIVTLRTFGAGLKYRTADSLGTSSFFGAFGVSAGFEPAMHATLGRTGGRTDELRFPSRWSFGVVLAAGAELMVADRVGIVGEVRRHLYFGAEVDDRPHVLAFNAGIVVNMSF